MKGRFDMAKWRWQTDLKAGLMPLLVYVAYLLYLFYRAPFSVCSLGFDEEGYPGAGTGVCFYLQFIPCMLIVFLTSSIFGECFRGSVRNYVVTFPVKTTDVILKRYLTLFVLLVLLHIPVILFAVRRINNSIDSFITSFPEYAGFPYVPVFPLMIQCVVGIAFYIALAVFLLFLFRDRYLPVILTIVYCILEAGPLIGILGNFCIFFGSFGIARLYSYLPANTVLMLILTVLFMAIVSARYRRPLRQ